MICIASSTGEIAAWNRSERPATMPSGMPTRSESPTAASISASVSMLASQRPSRAKEANADAVITAARTPPNLSTVIVPTAAAPSQLSQRIALVNQSTRSSTNVAKPSNTLKNGLSGVAERWSRSHDWKESSFAERPFQTSEFGHG